MRCILLDCFSYTIKNKIINLEISPHFKTLKNDTSVQ